MYRDTMIVLIQMYTSIVSNPASAFAASAAVYSHFPSERRRGSLPVNSRATWYWKPPKNWPMQG